MIVLQDVLAQGEQELLLALLDEHTPFALKMKIYSSQGLSQEEVEVIISLFEDFNSHQEECYSWDELQHDSYYETSLCALGKLEAL